MKKGFIILLFLSIFTDIRAQELAAHDEILSILLILIIVFKTIGNWQRKFPN
jgi:hypothetical protein